MDSEKPEILPEYDFSRAVRGRHAEAYAKGSNVVRLDDDVAAAFPTAAHVNEALRRCLGEATVSTKVFRVIDKTDTPNAAIDAFRRIDKRVVIRVERVRKV